jgi:hypothetical protein
MLSKGISAPSSVAVLAGFDQPLGFTQSGGVNENDVLLFGSRIEEVARHRG